MTTAQWRTSIEGLPTQDWRSGAGGVLFAHDEQLRTGVTFAATKTWIQANKFHADRLTQTGQAATYAAMTA